MICKELATTRSASFYRVTKNAHELTLMRVFSFKGLVYRIRPSFLSALN